MKTIRVKEEWQRAGVYYVRTQAMVLGFDLSLEGEFADDTPDGKYILVTDDYGKPLIPGRQYGKITLPSIPAVPTPMVLAASMTALSICATLATIP